MQVLLQEYEKKSGLGVSFVVSLGSARETDNKDIERSRDDRKVLLQEYEKDS